MPLAHVRGEVRLGFSLSGSEAAVDLTEDVPLSTFLDLAKKLGMACP